MRQAKQELHRRIADLPPDSIERVTNCMVELVNGDRLIIRSGQDPHCLDGMDHNAEIVTVGQLGLIREDVWDLIDYRRTVGSENGQYRNQGSKRK